MQKYLISPKLNQYKANMHSHSTLSDGKYEVEFLKEEYKKRGYSVFAFSDHVQVHDLRHLDDPEFLTLVSAEMDVPPNYDREKESFNCVKCFHYNVFAREPDNREEPVRIRGIYESEGVKAGIEDAKSKNYFVSANHPGWSLFDEKDFGAIEGLDAIEIGNSITATFGGGLSFMHDIYLYMLRNGQRVLPLGGDDNHSFCKPLSNPNNDSFKNFTYILSDKLEYKSIINALDNGDAYYSAGPQFLEIEANGDDITVKTTGVRQLSIITENGKAFSARAHKCETVDTLKANVSQGGKFFVAFAVDNKGKPAITRGFFKGEDY